MDVYNRAAKRFEEFLVTMGWSLSSFPPGVLSEFSSALSKTVKARSVRTYMYGVIQYLKWLKRRGYKLPEYEEPILPRIKTDIPLVLSEGSLAAYIEVCREMREPFCSAMKLLGFTTLRVKELCRLKLDDIIPTAFGTTLRVLESKGGSRPVPTPIQFTAELKAYLRGYRANIDSIWLFPNPKDPEKHIMPRNIQARFRLVREKLGLVGFTPHTIRRTWLTIMLRRGVDLITMAKIAGHKDLSTTRIYVVPSVEDLFNAVNKQ